MYCRAIYHISTVSRRKLLILLLRGSFGPGLPITCIRWPTRSKIFVPRRRGNTNLVMGGRPGIANHASPANCWHINRRAASLDDARRKLSTFGGNCCKALLSGVSWDVASKPSNKVRARQERRIFNRSLDRVSSEHQMPRG